MTQLGESEVLPNTGHLRFSLEIKMRIQHVILHSGNIYAGDERHSYELKWHAGEVAGAINQLSSPGQFWAHASLQLLHYHLPDLFVEV